MFSHVSTLQDPVCTCGLPAVGRDLGGTAGSSREQRKGKAPGGWKGSSRRSDSASHQWGTNLQIPDMRRDMRKQKSQPLQSSSRGSRHSQAAGCWVAGSNMCQAEKALSEVLEDSSSAAKFGNFLGPDMKGLLKLYDAIRMFMQLFCLALGQRRTI